MIRDRIKDLRRVKASDLCLNPKNWRTHSDSQKDAMKSVLAEVGIADVLIAYERDDGSLMLVDGHLRQGISGDQEVPVIVLDVNDQEADMLLATLDPISAMANKDRNKLSALLDSVRGANSIGPLLEEVARVNQVAIFDDVDLLIDIEEDDEREPKKDFTVCPKCGFEF